jgi:hypothetical protein
MKRITLFKILGIVGLFAFIGLVRSTETQVKV